MKKLTFGTPEEITPSKFCEKFSPIESEISYDVSKITGKKTKRGYLLEFPLSPKEQIYGFGLQMKGFNHKGRKLTLRVNADPIAKTGDSHAPVPFFVSTGCYGMYFDTARSIQVHCGYKKKHPDKKAPMRLELIDNVDDLYAKEVLEEPTVMSVEIPSASGIDVYVFEGDCITDVVSQYNMLSGGGCSVPDWGLGVLYRAYLKSDAERVKKTADYFRDNNIPCDILGLEPGWLSAAYSCSFEWNKEFFPNPKEVIDYLHKKDFHINLWEHAYVHPASPIYDELYPYSGDYEVWNGIVPDFATSEARKIFSEHHKQFIELGVDGFKLDECDNSDYGSCWCFPDCTEFPSGMDGEQYHAMFGVLYMQTILKALKKTPTLSEVRSAGALCASYPFVLYSDLYDHKDFIRAVVNSGFSGLLWTPEVRKVQSKKEFVRRLQTTVFSVQCLINAWHCEEFPWKDYDCENEIRELLTIRKTLVPMLSKAFKQYHETGKPPIRALVADYTEDKETYEIDDEYIFCDDLIVAPLSYDTDEREVYLPKGKWRDYWTKEPVESGRFTVVTENIPVYEKAD